jgi:NADH dehydrogenase/NADH:ubiquinone oxidoreductase subunit G
MNTALHGGMRMRRSLISGWVAFLFLISTHHVLRAQETSKDTVANVPALTEFHNVIYKIWHTAWPKKDYDMLAALLPEIEKGTAAVVGAELPGILRDKKAAWDKGTGELRSIVKEYRTAVEAKQKEPLLDAAEKLHAQYETLVRVIRPPLRQLEEFHAVLYMIYHHYMPGESLDKIKASLDPLREKMAALNKAALPARFKGKEASFTAARKDLDKAVSELSAAVSSKDLGKIKAAVETTHDRYVTLAAVLE